MPGLKKALRRRGNRRSHPRRPISAPAAVGEKISVTRVGKDDETGRAQVFVGYPETTAELEPRAALLASATAVRFVTAGELVVLDLVRGTEAIGRLLSNIVDGRLAELVGEREIDIKIHSADDPEWESAPTRTLPATRHAVSHDVLYGEPEVHGEGLEFVEQVHHVSMRWTIHRFRTAEEADAFLGSSIDEGVTQLIPKEEPATPCPESWRSRFYVDELCAAMLEQTETSRVGDRTYCVSMPLPGAAGLPGDRVRPVD